MCWNRLRAVWRRDRLPGNLRVVSGSRRPILLVVRRVFPLDGGARSCCLLLLLPGSSIELLKQTHIALRSQGVTSGCHCAWITRGRHPSAWRVYLLTGVLSAWVGDWRVLPRRVSCTAGVTTR